MSRNLGKCYKKYELVLGANVLEYFALIRTLLKSYLVFSLNDSYYEPVKTASFTNPGAAVSFDFLGNISRAAFWDCSTFGQFYFS